MSEYVDDLKFEYFSVSGKVNDNSTGVRLTHLPTSVVVVSDHPKNGIHFNKRQAFEMLQQKLKKDYQWELHQN